MGLIHGRVEANAGLAETTAIGVGTYLVGLEPVQCDPHLLRQFMAESVPLARPWAVDRP